MSTFSSTTGVINYVLSVTGDTSSKGEGAIKISNLPTTTGTQETFLFDWVEPNLNYDFNVTSSTRTNLYEGTYLIRVSNNSVPDNYYQLVTVPISSKVYCTITGIRDTTCGLDNGAVTGQTSSSFGKDIFKLFDINNNLLASSESGFFQNMSAGTYYMTTEDYGGSTGTSQSFVIQNSTQLDFGFFVVPNSACKGNASGKLLVTGLTGTPPYTYTWNNGETGTTITGLTTGPYSVEITDSKNCTVKKTVSVPTEDALGFINIVNQGPTCFQNNGVMTINISGGTGPYLYSLSKGYNIISYSKSLQITGLSPYVYSVIVTDASFCQINETSDMSGENGGIAEVTVETKNSTCSSNDGSITIGVRNGAEPFLYTLIYPKGDTISKSSYQSQYLFDKLQSGTYSISVLDSNQCSYIQEVTILTEDKFVLDVNSTGTTFGQNNGVIEVTILTGGTPPFNYTLDGSRRILKTILTSVKFSDLNYGQHSIVVSDSTGCYQTINASISNFEPVRFFLTSKSADNGNDGEVNAFISSGVPPFSYTWSPNVNGNPQNRTITGLTAGTYSVTITDSNNSSLTKKVDVGGSKIFDSYEIYEMGSQTFESISNTKYGFLQLLNEGYNDLISGQTDCDLITATFNAVLTLMPMGLVTTQPFYTTTSLFDVPSENLWTDTVKNLLLQTQGISDVEVNEFDNTLKIISDVNNPQVIKGPESVLDIVVDVSIEYEINCR